MIISLCGFMGCGKSSVGRKLSTLLCCSYMDLDAYIEAETGRCIPDIFAEDGEGAFRVMELEALQKIVSCPLTRVMEQSLPSQAMGPSLCGQRGSTVPSPPSEGKKTSPESSEIAEGGKMILSLGGGTVMTPQCAEIVHEKTLCVYLRASVDTLMSHLAGETEGRPMLNSGKPSECSGPEALRNRIIELMSIRSATYENTAHIIIDIDGKNIEDICSEILASLETVR